MEFLGRVQLKFLKFFCTNILCFVEVYKSLDNRAYFILSFVPFKFLSSFSQAFTPLVYVVSIAQAIVSAALIYAPPYVFYKNYEGKKSIWR